MAQSNVQAERCRSSRWAEGSQTSSAADALWICQNDLLRCFDSETRGTRRLVCKQACKAFEDNTRCLSWKGPDSAEVRTALVDLKDESRDLALTMAFHIALQAYDTKQRIPQQCPVLEKICGLHPEAYQHLASIPTSLRTLEIQRCLAGLVKVKGCKIGHQWYQLQHVNLYPLTALTGLEEAVLQGLPASILAALDLHTALRSLNDVTALPACCNMNDLDLSDCATLQDITAL
eukprot:gene32400-biopygen1086